jgi:hypothetical protein
VTGRESSIDRRRECCCCCCCRCCRKKVYLAEGRPDPKAFRRQWLDSSPLRLFRKLRAISEFPLLLLFVLPATAKRRSSPIPSHPIPRTTSKTSPSPSLLHPPSKFDLASRVFYSGVSSCVTRRPRLRPYSFCLSRHSRFSILLLHHGPQ